MFKYRTKFTSLANVSLDVEKDLHISRASLDSLKSIIPASVDLEKNIDLIGVAFNAAVVNKFNKNDDGIDTAAALALRKYFIHKPTNIEHKRNRVVGHIVNSAFSKYGSNELISEEELAGYIDPFNICLAAVVYQTVDKNFANALMQACDKESPLYQKISASWEVGFNDYYVALGGEDIKDAEIVTNPAQVKELSKFLKRNGGAGCLEDGTMARCLITGTIYPLGIGYTTNPAADVKGVVVDNGETETEEDDECEKDKENEQEESVEVNSESFLNVFHKKISQDKNDTVNINKSKLMDLEQIIAAFKTALAAEKQDTVKFSDEAVASISAKIADAIKAKDQEFKDKITAAETAQAQAAADAAKVKSDLEQAMARLNDLESAAKAKASQELFNSRMSTLDQDYDFEDADRAILAKDLSGLDSSDESFASYKERVSVLFKQKSKAFKVEQEKAFNEKLEAELVKRGVKVSTASANVDEALKNAKPADGQKTPVSTVDPTDDSNKPLSWKDRVAKSFSKENVSIKY